MSDNSETNRPKTGNAQREGTSAAKQYVECSMERPEVTQFARGWAGVFSARCPGTEAPGAAQTPPNEDAAALIPFGEDAGVLVVADGMGGSPAGHKASALAIQEMQRAVEQAFGTETLLRTAILDGFENANRAVLDMATGAATTMVVVALQGSIVRPYHVGDSVILVVGNHGKVKHQTVAHSPIGYGLEAGLLDEAEAMHHEDRHLVSNIVGSAEMHIDIGPSLTLAPFDTILLATDGLADNLHTHEIVDLARKGPLLKALGRLGRLAHARMTDPLEGKPSKPDDVTFIGFRLTRQRSRRRARPHEAALPKA